MDEGSESRTSDDVQGFVLENSAQPLPHAGFYFCSLHSHAHTLQPLDHIDQSANGFRRMKIIISQLSGDD